eukprot:3364812-Rhodomonas_salina.2
MSSLTYVDLTSKRKWPLSTRVATLSKTQLKSPLAQCLLIRYTVITALPHSQPLFWIRAPPFICYESLRLHRLALHISFA